ncbi:MAG: PhzF family phenazine biosynthesis protein [Alphaproteobacteria bacterium]|nr:PhzF family phenazine biosynthesis protein [Alphaproteobacteria bacterium]
MREKEDKIYVVDAFVGEGLAGNPAAVCPRGDWLADEVMQSVAREMALSETAFFAPVDDGYLLRWFTPATEVDLCGHATLSSAAVYFTFLDPGASAVRFQTLKAGVLTVTRNGDLLELDFPARPAGPGSPDGLAAALGATPADILRIPGATCMAVFDSEDAVRGLTPDMALLSALEDRMIIATAPGEQADFMSRCFAPRAGIDEDPVTGSAHTTLVPYWSTRLGKAELRAVQASARGGELFCTDRGDRVAIAGRAAIRSAGTLDLAGALPRAELIDA